MPTGYTMELCDKDISFEKFILTCARAFGACIEMRDSSLNVPIPDEFKPSDYHLKEIRSTEEKLADVLKMTEEQVKEAWQKEIEEVKKQYKQHVKDATEKRNRLEKMREKVIAWKPPSEDHEGLKVFMLDQLNDTLKHDGCVYHELYQQHLKKLDNQDWRKSKIEELKRDIEYHKKGYEEDLDRANGRTKWVSMLRKSVKESQL